MLISRRLQWIGCVCCLMKPLPQINYRKRNPEKAALSVIAALLFIRRAWSSEDSIRSLYYLYCYCTATIPTELIWGRGHKYFNSNVRSEEGSRVGSQSDHTACLGAGAWDGTKTYLRRTTTYVRVYLLCSATAGSRSNPQILLRCCLLKVMDCCVLQDVDVVNYQKHDRKRCLIPPHHSMVKPKIGHSTVHKQQLVW